MESEWKQPISSETGWNLSDKITDERTMLQYSTEEVLKLEDVREFVKRLKDICAFSADPLDPNFHRLEPISRILTEDLHKKIDKLAGEKLI